MESRVKSGDWCWKWWDSCMIMNYLFSYFKFGKVFSQSQLFSESAQWNVNLHIADYERGPRDELQDLMTDEVMERKLKTQNRSLEFTCYRHTRMHAKFLPEWSQEDTSHYHHSGLLYIKFIHMEDHVAQIWRQKQQDEKAKNYRMTQFNWNTFFSNQIMEHEKVRLYWPGVNLSSTRLYFDPP